MEAPFSGINLFIKIFDFTRVAHFYAIGGLIVAFLIWFFAIRKRRSTAKWKRILIWTGLTLIALVSFLILFGQYYIANMMGG